MTTVSGTSDAIKFLGASKCDKSMTHNWNDKNGAFHPISAMDFLPREELRRIQSQRLKELVSKFGPKWAVLTSYFPGRTDNALKNRYNVHLNENKKPRKKSSKAAVKEEEVKDTVINLLPDDVALSYDSTLNFESLPYDSYETNIEIETQNWITNIISLDD